MGVDIYECSNAAIEEQSIHQVHKCEEAIIPQIAFKKILTISVLLFILSLFMF
jgi:hypothetical protein